MTNQQRLYGVAERIGMTMQAANTSPEQFANEVDITVDQATALKNLNICNLEPLEDFLSLERIVRISYALPATVEYLITNRGVAVFQVDKDNSGFFDYYNDPENKNEKIVYDRLYDFEERGYFDDMLFDPASITGKLTAITSRDADKELVSCNMERPQELEDFTFGWIKVIVSDIPGCQGCFNEITQELTISESSINDDRVLLHEMIHIYEYVINSLPSYYHDVLCWALYSDLSEKINGLNESISDQAHLLNMTDITNSGGTHDILFFLKSLDLDIKMGYPFGTVFAYGKENELTNLKMFGPKT